jgi:hypothetical protein
VAGPWQAATVSGQVPTTNSRFLKNIDIIPPAAGPARAASTGNHARSVVTRSAFARLEIDLTIKSKDPFLIRGTAPVKRC